VRRIEVMPLGENLESEVDEHLTEPFRQLAELVRVAGTTQREVHGTAEGGQGFTVEVGPE
jgi:hypothetical protein